MSYMTNRKMLVKYKNAISEEHTVEMGVPQGSVLGPLLFISFVNDLPEHISIGKVTMFADDTTITVSALTPEELSLRIMRVCDELEAWCQRNRLILNDKKSLCKLPHK